MSAWDGSIGDPHGWQPMATAPKDGTRVLLCLSGEVAIGNLDPEDYNDGWAMEHGDIWPAPEGWQLLPSAAGAQRADGKLSITTAAAVLSAAPAAPGSHPRSGT